MARSIAWFQAMDIDYLQLILDQFDDGHPLPDRKPYYAERETVEQQLVWRNTFHSDDMLVSIYAFFTDCQHMR